MYWGTETRFEYLGHDRIWTLANVKTSLDHGRVRCSQTSILRFRERPKFCFADQPTGTLLRRSTIAMPTPLIRATYGEVHAQAHRWEAQRCIASSMSFYFDESNFQAFRLVSNWWESCEPSRHYQDKNHQESLSPQPTFEAISVCAIFSNPAKCLAIGSAERQYYCYQHKLKCQHPAPSVMWDLR